MTRFSPPTFPALCRFGDISEAVRPDKDHSFSLRSATHPYMSRADSFSLLGLTYRRGAATSSKDYRLYLSGQTPHACRFVEDDLRRLRAIGSRVCNRTNPSLVMNAERASTSAPKRPPCPSCAQNMRLIRRTPRFGGLPDVCTFECQACGVSHTEECEPPPRVC